MNKKILKSNKKIAIKCNNYKDYRDLNISLKELGIDVKIIEPISYPIYYLTDLCYLIIWRDFLIRTDNKRYTIIDYDDIDDNNKKFNYVYPQSIYMGFDDCKHLWFNEEEASISLYNNSDSATDEFTEEEFDFLCNLFLLNKNSFIKIRNQKEYDTTPAIDKRPYLFYAIINIIAFIIIILTLIILF